MRKPNPPKFDQRQFDVDMFAPLSVDTGPGTLTPGLIYASNEARFTSGFYSEPLTAYTVGWTDPENLDQILNDLFPLVMVGRRFEFKVANNAQSFLSDADDTRSPGSPFKRVEYNGTTVNSKTGNRGLTMRVDHDEVEDLEAAVTQRLGWLLARLKRNSLRRGFTLLSAAATDIGGKVWSSTSNPDGDLRYTGKACADACGVYANVFAIGEAAWNMRLDAYEAAARLNQNRATWTTQQLAQYLGADIVQIIKSRYQATATAKSVVIPSQVFAYIAFKGAGKDDPSSVKRFMSSARGGGAYGVYRQQYEKFDEISVELYENQVQTGLGVQSIEPTAS